MYDIVCALSIICFSNQIYFFSDIHSSVFQTPLPSATKRFMAYWIFTYGTIRLAAALDPSQTTYTLAAFSYSWEAICLVNELNKDTNPNPLKNAFIIISSSALSFYLLFALPTMNPVRSPDTFNATNT